MCTFLRVDSTDLTQAASGGKHAGMIHAEDLEELLVWWAEDDDNAGLTTSQIRFRRVNTRTGALSTEVTIQDSTNKPNGLPMMVRLDDSARTLVMAYGQGSSYGTAPKVKISVDNGDTWTVETPPAAPEATNNQPIAIAHYGSECWLALMIGGGGTGNHDFYVSKRSSAGSWGGFVKVYNSNGIGGTPGAFEWTYGNWWQRRMVMLSATNGVLIGPRCEDAGSDAEKKISILRTTNAWTGAATVIDVATYPTADDGGGKSPSIAVNSEGRLIAAWCYMPSGGSGTNNIVKVAYSDDEGVTWTNTGTPAAISTAQADSDTSMQFRPSTEPALTIVPGSDTVFLSTMADSNSDAAAQRRFRKFSGRENSTAGWTQNDCTVDMTTDNVQLNSLYVYTCEFTPSGLYMVIGAASNTGSYERVYLILDETYAVNPEPGPEAPLPSESGADENNVYARKVLGPASGGWSFHTKAVACWMPWDEGDKETGREVPILVAGSEAWPTIQDPALIGIINRIEAPDLYADRHYIFNDITYDPLKVEIETKHYQLSGPHDKNAMRAIFLAYERAGGPFDVELWVDGQIVDLYQFQGTEGNYVEKFRAVKTFGNVGSEAWLRIRDESVDPLVIYSMEFIFIKKGWRGNNAAQA